MPCVHISFFFFFNDTATTEIYTLSLHDALPIYTTPGIGAPICPGCAGSAFGVAFSVTCSRSEEHTSELQSLRHLVCRLLLEKKKNMKFTNKHFVRVLVKHSDVSECIPPLAPSIN